LRARRPTLRGMESRRADIERESPDPSQAASAQGGPVKTVVVA
jgi:hypothetical protein